MPPFLINLISAIGLKGIAIGVGVLAVGGGLWGFIAHERAIGEAACEAKVKAATDAEIARQAAVNDYWQQWAQSAIQAAGKQKANINEQRRRLALATANDNGVCLRPDVVDQLRAIGRASGQTKSSASPGVPQR